MIGNDIVDLTLAKRESNWQRRGFLDKVFSPTEQLLIRRALNPDKMVWRLWSMKESAYKCMYRTDYVRRFNPKAFETSIEEDVACIKTGCVWNNGAVFHTKTFITQNIVHSWGSISKKLLQRLQPVVSEDYTILTDLGYSKDSNGIPVIGNETTGTYLYLSVSHHGRFCSYISTMNDRGYWG